MTDLFVIVAVVAILVLIGPWIVKFYVELFRGIQKGEE